MARVTRRRLLQMGAGAGLTALAADPLVSAAMAKRKLPPADLTDIEHVVILIQENRSFDHYFGMLPGVRGFGDKTAPKSVFEQQGYPGEGFGGKLLPFHLPTEKGLGNRCYPDITHSWIPMHEAWDNGANDMFVAAHEAHDGTEATPACMSYMERADVPLYWALAENYTICDNYHCSVLGPTYPNRLFSVSATNDPEGKGGGPLVETTNDFEFVKARFTWTTMPEQLTAHGITWKSYTGTELGYEDNPLGFFKQYWENPELKAKGLEARYPTDFITDLRHQELPQVSWINASLPADEHPGNSGPASGEELVQNIIKNLHRHKVWEKTVLFITWDENGGFFDHVPPPVAPPETPGEYLTVPDIEGKWGGIAGPIGLGFRVPLLVTGPFARGGFLCSDTFDHTSLLRFLETRFGAEVPNLSEWRRETTGDLTSALNLKEPDNSKGKLPKIVLSAEEHGNGACEIDEPMVPPPNSFPVQPDRTWRTPSGP